VSPYGACIPRSELRRLAGPVQKQLREYEKALMARAEKSFAELKRRETSNSSKGEVMIYEILPNQPGWTAEALARRLAGIIIGLDAVVVLKDEADPNGSWHLDGRTNNYWLGPNYLKEEGTWRLSARYGLSHEALSFIHSEIGLKDGVPC
jgi:hypothetical protein